MRRHAAYFPQGISMYVPGMQFAADANRGIWEGSLGLPVYDQDGIDNDTDGDAVAGVVVYAGDMDGAEGRESDATYGQTVVMKVSADPGATGVAADIYGEDYLGQPMVERLTTANGATAEVEGQKAFKRVTSIKMVTAATNAITFDIGWGHAIGLPYKIATMLAYGSGANDMLPLGYSTSEAVAAMDAGAAATAKTVVAPIDGYITGSSFELTTAQATSAATITTTVAAGAQTGLTMLIPVGAIGASFDNNLAKANWIPVAKGDAIVATSDGGGDTGVGVLKFTFQSADPVVEGPDLTDPATVTTNDPRGTVTPAVTLSGTVEFFAKYIASSSVNAAGNGGLMGIKHYIG